MTMASAEIREMASEYAKTSKESNEQAEIKMFGNALSSAYKTNTMTDEDKELFTSKVAKIWNTAKYNDANERTEIEEKVITTEIFWLEHAKNVLCVLDFENGTFSFGNDKYEFVASMNTDLCNDMIDFITKMEITCYGYNTFATN